MQQNNQAKLQKEIEGLESFHHPLVCDLVASSLNYQIDSIDNYWILLDFSPGLNLDNFIKIDNKQNPNSPFKPSFIYKISWGLVYIISKMHESSIIHRDIKPDNIIIDPNFFPHIIDLGEVAPLDDNGERVTNNPHGTPDYCPPETFSNIQTPSVDVFCLGGTIYTLITKEHPFHDIVKQHVCPEDLTSGLQYLFSNNLISFLCEYVKLVCCDKKYEPGSDNFDKLDPKVKDLMQLVYDKCWLPTPEERASVSELQQYIIELAQKNLNQKEREEFYIFVEILQENALPPYYGTIDNIGYSYSEQGIVNYKGLLTSSFPTLSDSDMEKIRQKYHVK